MDRFARLAVLSLMFGGCGGRPPPPPVRAPGPGDVAVAPPPASDAAVEAVPAPAPAPITDDECGRYVDHVLALGQAAMGSTTPPELMPTADQLTAIRARLLASGPCRELPRDQWACAISAPDQPALYACGER